MKETCAGNKPTGLVAYCRATVGSLFMVFEEYLLTGVAATCPVQDITWMSVVKDTSYV